MPDSGIPGLDRARDALASARTALVLTGAGVSAESGVPTFRGEEGLWRQYRPEELATPDAFRRDPRLVWEWYGMRRTVVGRCSPNPAHRALASWCLAEPGVRTLVTQNVDGLHERAVAEVLEGAAVPDAARPLALHGSLFRARCTRCPHREEHRGGIDASGVDTLPRCSACGALLRPDVVWFGEALSPEVLERAFDAARRADVCLVVGTSARVHPAASLPDLTRSAGGSVVEVNPEATALTARADHSLRGPAGRILPALLDAG